MSWALLGSTTISGLALFALHRLVVGLDEAEAGLRSVVSGVRTLRRGLAEATALAGGLGSRATDSEAALHSLLALKLPATDADPDGSIA